MTTEPRASLVEVTSADLDAARPFMDRYLDGSSFAEDREDLAIAFARHRLEALRTPADARSRFALAAAKIECDVRLSELTDAEIDSLVEALRTQGDGEAWRDISEAPKDGTVIWAVLHPQIFPDLKPGREDLQYWNGVQVPLRHPGIVEGYDGKPFDMGWNIAAPVGQGGFPDEWIIGWRLPPAARTQEDGAND